jgi:hypothetical protein
MARKPSFDRANFKDKLNELAAFFLVEIIEPTTSIGNLVLLQDLETGSIGWCMSENKYFPALLQRVGLTCFLKPLQLQTIAAATCQLSPQVKCTWHFGKL